jgi:hypothetical protein
MVTRLCAVALVILAVLPFMAPFRSMEWASESAGTAAHGADADTAEAQESSRATTTLFPVSVISGQGEIAGRFALTPSSRSAPLHLCPTLAIALRV